MGKVGKFKVCFRDEQLTSHAGVVLVHELARLLGVEQIVDEEVHVKQRERGYPEGQAVGGLIYNLLLGGDCLSDLEVLRGDPGTQELLAQAVRETGEQRLDAAGRAKHAGAALPGRMTARGEVDPLITAQTAQR